MSTYPAGKPQSGPASNATALSVGVPTETRVRAMRLFSLTVLGVALCFAASNAHAGGDKDCRPQPQDHSAKAKTADFMKKRWKKVDLNKDGVISREEYLKEANDRFNATDMNKDGKLTPEEVQQFFEMIEQKSKEKTVQGAKPATP